MISNLFLIQWKYQIIFCYSFTNTDHNLLFSICVVVKQKPLRFLGQLIRLRKQSEDIMFWYQQTE